MNAVVITGATGFIGRHLVRYMLDRGLDVYAVVRSCAAEGLPAHERLYAVEGEISHWETLTAHLPQEPEAFIHLAWTGAAPEYRNNTCVQNDNVALCLNGVKLASAIHAKRFILPGSTMEYAYCGGPIEADSCPSPQNAYGASKIAARFLCQSLCEELGLPFIYVVITGIYSADRRDSNVITYAITELLSGRRPSFTALEQLWDYVHIDDVVRALYLTALRGKPGAFYTVGHGDNWPLSNYIYKIRNLIDPALPMGIGDIPYKNGRLPSSCVDLTAIRKDTGFEPQVPFEQGIREVIERLREEIEIAG